MSKNGGWIQEQGIYLGIDSILEASLIWERIGWRENPIIYSFWEDKGGSRFILGFNKGEKVRNQFNCGDKEMIARNVCNFWILVSFMNFWQILEYWKFVGLQVGVLKSKNVTLLKQKMARVSKNPCISWFPSQPHFGDEYIRKWNIFCLCSHLLSILLQQGKWGCGDFLQDFLYEVSHL